MAKTNLDAAVQLVVDSMRTIVGSEGGSPEVEELRNGHLKIRYTEGRNDECPECVPTHETVLRLMTASLQIHAPHIREIELL